AGEVLGEVTQHVGVVAAGGEDVDEAEELRLEGGMRHRPVEDVLAPAPEVEEMRTLRRTRFGDPARERLHLVLEGIHQSSLPRARPTLNRAIPADKGIDRA